ncbi:hypothetical protein BJX70DRAFT_393430 [Aspergillus crustosus]
MTEVTYDVDGDVLVTCCGTLSRVSSKAISLASPVLRAMFNLGFKEGLTLVKDGSYVLDLPQDDPEALAVFCHIAYHKSQSLARKLTPDTLQRLSVFIDKYSCRETFLYQARVWMQQPLGDLSAEDLWKLLQFAYVLEFNGSFENITRELLLKRAVHFADWTFAVGNIIARISGRDENHKPAARIYAECVLCNRHLCAKHSGPGYHTCPKWEDEAEYDPAARKAEQDEITDLVSRINIPALLSRASELRGGIACSIPRSLEYDKSKRRSVMGGMNYHIEILFEDGIRWMARFRRTNATSPPPELQDYIMRSEVATLRFLRQTKVPVPRVFGFSCSNSNPSMATPEQCKKVIGQLADIYIELKAHPFLQTGSLHNPESLHEVGPFARESLTVYHGSEMEALGPFPSTEKYFNAHIRLVLDLIAREEMYVNQPVNAYLIHRFLLDNVPEACSQRHLDDGEFYLKHADEKGDHILVDDDYNITGILDWEWAHTDSKSSFQLANRLTPCR